MVLMMLKRLMLPGKPIFIVKYNQPVDSLGSAGCFAVEKEFPVSRCEVTMKTKRNHLTAAKRGKTMGHSWVKIFEGGVIGAILWAVALVAAPQLSQAQEDKQAIIPVTPWVHQRLSGDRDYSLALLARALGDKLIHPESKPARSR